jgi:hypothetical protein
LETLRGQIAKEGAAAVQKAQQIFTHRGSLAANQSEARLRTASGEIEETLRTSSTEHAKRLLVVSHRVLGELQEQAKTLVEGARADLNRQAARGAQETLAIFTRKAQEVAREYGAQLENRLQEFRRRSEQLPASTSSSLDASFQPEHPVGTSEDLTGEPSNLSPPPRERAPDGAAARKM